MWLYRTSGGIHQPAMRSPLPITWNIKRTPWKGSPELTAPHHPTLNSYSSSSTRQTDPSMASQLTTIQAQSNPHPHEGFRIKRKALPEPPSSSATATTMRATGTRRLPGHEPAPRPQPSLSLLPPPPPITFWDFKPRSKSQYETQAHLRRDVRPVPGGTLVQNDEDGDPTRGRGGRKILIEMYSVLQAEALIRNLARLTVPKQGRRPISARERTVRLATVLRPFLMNSFHRSQSGVAFSNVDVDGANNERRRRTQGQRRGAERGRQNGDDHDDNHVCTLQNLADHLADLLSFPELERAMGDFMEAFLLPTARHGPGNLQTAAAFPDFAKAVHHMLPSFCDWALTPSTPPVSGLSPSHESSSHGDHHRYTPSYQGLYAYSSPSPDTSFNSGTSGRDRTTTTTPYHPHPPLPTTFSASSRRTPGGRRTNLPCPVYQKHERRRDLTEGPAFFLLTPSEHYARFIVRVLRAVYTHSDSPSPTTNKDDRRVRWMRDPQCVPTGLDRQVFILYHVLLLLHHEEVNRIEGRGTGVPRRLGREWRRWRGRAIDIFREVVERTS